MSCTNSNKPPVIQLQQVPQLPTYPDASSPGDKEAVVDQYRNDLNRALYKNIQQLNNALSPPPGVDGTNGAAGGGGGLVNMVSPLTTKGDIWGYNTNNARIPVGTDGTVLTADSTNALGVSYQTPSGGGATTIVLVASQNLAQGDCVNIFNSSGTPKVRKASATSGFEAHGFTNAAVTSGNNCTVQLSGLNVYASGLTAGRVFLHTTDGLVSNTCPSASGQMGQEVGEAYASGSWSFAWKPGVLLATSSAPGNAGSLRGQEFTASGTFVTPTNVTSLWITMIGGGGAGGGATAAGVGAGGGGAGELVQFLPVIATSGASVTVTVGAGGTGVSGADGGAGTDTSFGTVFAAKGGKGGLSVGTGGNGGGSGGGTGPLKGTPGVIGTGGALEAPTYYGGSSGGSGGGSTTNNGGAGGGSGGYAGGALGVAAGSQAGGGGGASTIFGLGGAAGGGGANGSNAAGGSYGAGGGGGGGKATPTTGGSGLAGYVLVQWIA